MIGSGQDLTSVLLIVTFDLNALRELVWLTSDLVKLSEGNGKGHEVVFHINRLKLNCRIIQKLDGSAMLAQ